MSLELGLSLSLVRRHSGGGGGGGSPGLNQPWLWINGADEKLYRMDLDSPAQPTLIGTMVAGAEFFAVDVEANGGAGYIFVAIDTASGSVWRYNLDLTGGSQQTKTGTTGSVAVDTGAARYILAELDLSDIDSYDYSGGSKTERVADSVDPAYLLDDITNNKIVWGDYSNNLKIATGNTTSASPTTLKSSIVPFSPAVDRVNQHAYYSASGAQTVRRIGYGGAGDAQMFDVGAGFGVYRMTFADDDGLLYYSRYNNSTTKEDLYKYDPVEDASTLLLADYMNGTSTTRKYLQVTAST